MILFKKAGEKQKEMLWERTIHVETQATKELVLLLTETGILFIQFSRVPLHLQLLQNTGCKFPVLCTKSL